MLDPETIAHIFRRLDLYTGQLSLLAGEDLSEDLVKLGAAKYYLQTAVECCIDVANHIIARQGLRAPESYGDAFTVLAESQVIPEQFAPTLHKMVGMRNRLVHLYWDVDVDIMEAVLEHNLADFKRFQSHILAYLRATTGLTDQEDTPNNRTGSPS